MGLPSAPEEVPGMGKSVLQQFGKYYLLDQIAEGGMAEVFRARHARADANGQVFVVKRILPHIADDAKFIEMFKAETRVCMGFSHPNTIQIFDFGSFSNVHYIAMEYVEGKTIAQILKRNLTAARPLPLAVSIGMVFLACSGLEYVHNFENRATGESLTVIHRDISPQNILVSYGGGVKLIDFGIAKIMVDNPDKTMPGVLKGKASYFSPEQARGLKLDIRSDIFSLGIVLWELLTGKRLFYRPNIETLELLEVVRTCETIVPPSHFNPAIPKALDQLVMKALQKDPDARIQNAGEFRVGLENVLKEMGQRAVGPSLSKFMRTLFNVEMTEERSSLYSLNQMAQEKLSDQTGSFGTWDDATAPIVSVASVATYPASAFMREQTRSEEYSWLHEVEESQRILTRPRKWAALIVALALALSWGGYTYFGEKASTPKYKPSRMAVSLPPSSGTVGTARESLKSLGKSPGKTPGKTPEKKKLRKKASRRKE